MRIKEFFIKRYGPLKDLSYNLLHNFNLFLGKNEDGKTLTIDALVKLQLGRKIRNFERIDRVEEIPEGYVIIEDDKGREIKLPEKGDLTKVVNLTPSECRNIFIIRNSDLSIARESEFYTNVTDRLTGLRTEEIIKIKETLREIGKITPSNTFRDIKDEKLKTRIENAKDLIEKINSLATEIKQERFDELEEETVRLREALDKIIQKLENLEDARKREKHKKGKDALDKLKKALEKSKDLEIYNEDDEQLWRDCKRELQTYNEEKEKLLTDFEDTEKELKEISKQLSEKERDFRVLDERKRILDDEVKPELKNYEIKSREVALQEGKSKFFTLTGIISAILLGISLLGAIIHHLLLFYLLAGLFSISTIVVWIFKFQFARNKSWLAGEFEKIKLTLSKFELSTEHIEGVLSNIQKFDEEYSKKFDEIQEIKRKKENLEEIIKGLREKSIPNKEKRIKEAQEKIDKIKRISMEESLQDYKSKLKLKQEYEKSLGEQRSILESLFEARGATLEQNISYWNEEIKALEEYKDKAKDIKYDEKTVSKLKEERNSCENKLTELNNKMKDFRKSLEEIERITNKILQLEADYLHCKTSVDLDKVREKLQEFINTNEINKDNVLRVMKIFEEIETEERKRVSELFGRDSLISKYFNRITDGLYEEVLFGQEIGKIKVKRRDGVILEAEKLSGGAYDQLYLSIRLVLGEKLLKGKKGFFIMDDPFVKADPDRLQRQIEVLKKIAKLGWQVIYFSAKGEIKDALRKDISRGNIHYIKIKTQNMLSSKRSITPESIPAQKKIDKESLTLF